MLEQCLELSNWMSIYVHCSRSPRSNWYIVIEFPEHMSDCPEPKTFKKFSHKNKSQYIYPWWGELEIRDSLGLKDLARPWQISAWFFDVGEICELRLHTVACLASHYVFVGKQHRTNCERWNCINGHELSPGYTEKVTTNPSLCKWNLFLYLCLYFCGIEQLLLLKFFIRSEEIVHNKNYAKQYQTTR